MNKKDLLIFIKTIINVTLYHFKKKRFGYLDKTAYVNRRCKIFNKKNVFLYEKTNLNEGGFIMNTRANFIMKKWSGAAFGLSVITGNHMSLVGKNIKQITDIIKNETDIHHEMDKDVIVEEDVWIASHVTLLSGSHIGRGCEVGAGSVVRGSVPPYSVVIGNPCKVVGFRFTPEEIIEHEKQQYEEAERLPIELLQKNYEKYFLNRIKDIKQFTKL